MAFPTTPATKVHLDSSTDDPSQARAELAVLVDKVNLMISSYALALGICDLDSGGKIPLARIPTGSATGLDADSVDGIHASATPVANKLLALDSSAKIPAAAISAGSGSGLDADKLDGYHASTSATASTVPVRDGSGYVPGHITGNAAYATSAGTAATANAVAASSINRTALKSATASQSYAVTTGLYVFSLTGGDYTLGWYLGGSAVNLHLRGHGGTYSASVGVWNTNDITQTAYLYSRYIQASPPYKIGGHDWGHFIYLLRNISTGEIIGSYEAEDPMWAYNGAIWEPKDSEARIASFSHPFTDYLERDPALDGLEIVLLDTRSFDAEAMKLDMQKRKKGLIDGILSTGKTLGKKDAGIPALAHMQNVKIKLIN